MVKVAPSLCLYCTGAICVVEIKFNFALICQQLEQAGGLQTVTQQNWADIAKQWLADLEQAQQKGKAAQSVVEANRGAKQKVFEWIQALF